MSISLMVPFPDMKRAIESVPHIIRSKVTPTAIEYMSRDTILFSENYLGKRFLDTKNDAYILLTFYGNTETQVEQDMSTVAELCLEIGAMDAGHRGAEKVRLVCPWRFPGSHQGIHYGNG